MDEEIFISIRNEVRAGLDITSAISNRELMQYIEEIVWGRPELRELTASARRILVRRVYDSFRGLDVLQPLVDNPAITEIMINSHKDVFIEQDGEVTRLEVHFESQSRLEDIIQTIVGTVNRVVNESSPIVDARLKDGSRVNIVLPPIALKGPTMTIRKFPESPMTMDNLVSRGALNQETADLLRTLVIGKYNIFISGGDWLRQDYLSKCLVPVHPC